MLMLSNRHLDPCDCFSLVSGKKFKMKILQCFQLLRSFPKNVILFFFSLFFFFWGGGGGGGAVYNCNFGIKLLEEKDCKQSLTQFMPLSFSDTR